MKMLKFLLVFFLLINVGCKPALQGPPKADPAALQEKPAAPEPPPVTPEPPKQNLLKRTTNLVVDKAKAMAENPNLEATENKVSGNDPLTISASAYISISSKANTIAFQHNIDLLKAAEGRNPTFDEITEFIKVNQMQFNALPDYQWYGYDQESGTFMVLQDPVLKKKLREEAGLPPE